MLQVITGDQIEEVQNMFPDVGAETIRKLFTSGKCGTAEEAIDHLLRQPQKPSSTATNSTKTTNTTTTPSTWSCSACTFDNKNSDEVCAMCSKPGPFLGRTPKPDTTKPEATTSPTKTRLIIPGWWDEFWKTQSSTICDFTKTQAEQLLFSEGKYKTDSILTVDLEQRLLQELGGSMVHEDTAPVAQPAFPFPRPILVRPPYHRPPGGGGGAMGKR
ncbi:hypothetical protein QOT17_007343 [Balamuthia mandrillaris]